jgi:hypothetical protein
MERPPHVILGKTQTDQDWIDGEVEAGVAACGFPRPGPRPASLDAPPATRQVAAPPPPPKRRGIIKRIRDRIGPPRRRPRQSLWRPHPCVRSRRWFSCRL